MSFPVSRRGLLAAPFTLAGCTVASPYFGKTTTPGFQRLVHSNGEEPSSLDPALSAGGNGDSIVAALLDSLTSLHPLTLEPAAGLATHYDVDSRGFRYTFYLRGHPQPRGIRLPNTDSLPPEFSRGRRAPPDSIPALWSDDTPVTAHDFVYAWRRIVDPATAAPLSFYLGPIGNAQEIIQGEKPPSALAVRALDAFAFQFDLVTPAPWLPRLLCQSLLAAVPRRAVEATRRRGQPALWISPANQVSSGPFLLREWRALERVVFRRNPRYWEADSVAIDELVFLPIANGVTNVNLYKAGEMQSMNPRLVPPLCIPALRKKKDFATSGSLRTFGYTFNVTKPPLDRLLLRYALNLATDKVAVAAFLSAGQKPAHGMVAPLPAYPPVQMLPVSVAGRTLDVMSFDPAAARDLLRSEGIANVELSLIAVVRPRSKEVAEIVQKQWHEHLGIRLKVNFQEETVWEQTFLQKRYLQVIEDTWTMLVDDPYDFLMQVGPAQMYTWTDPAFDRAFNHANAITDPLRRMDALAACEAQLMQAMPTVPIFHDTWAHLEAPYLHGLRPNPFGSPRFKYAWIDTNWRPS
jgi:oligopeptide transport system substrate-binding protein